MSSQTISGHRFTSALLAAMLVLTGVSTVISSLPASALSSQLSWKTVANFNNVPPGSPSSTVYNSFSQPSVNDAGLVVFRARTKAAQGGQPVRGIYTRNMAGSNQPISTVAEVGDTVPAPNNTSATFNEFPAFPRIDATSSNVSTRGQSSPVLSVTLPDLTTTKTGTSGVYVTTGGSLETGVSLLGNVPGYEIYSVPGAPTGTKFDQFPGASSMSGNTLVFKGNYTIGTSTGLTGDFYRDLTSSNNAVQLIADSSTTIPGTSSTFGSTAPPSAAAGKAVFTGWDNEGTPTVGGIYLADLTPSPALTTLVKIGDQVPGQGGATFSNFGEGLSFDGRYVGFWASWGATTSGPTLSCPTDGNADLIAYCLAHDNGFVAPVPAHQGVFVYDTVNQTLSTVAIDDSRFAGFQYWVYSGAPPGVGSGTDSTQEPPRWRVSAFVAVSGLSGNNGYQVAFKATTTDGVDGIYVGQGPTTPRVLAAVRTTDAASGVGFDSTAPAGQVVTSAGLERDGLRNGNLVVNAAMLNQADGTGWGGVYLATVPSSLSVEAQTITFDPVTGAYAGDSQSLAAITSSGLPVSYSVGSSSQASVCSVNVSTVTFNRVGTCVVAADAAGDGSYLAATQTTLTINVVLHPQVITFTAPATVYLGSTYSLSATSDAGLPVSYLVDTATTTGACLLSGNVVTFSSLGSCVIKADQAGSASDGVAAASPVTVTMTVVARPPVVIPPSVTTTSPALAPQVITVPPAPAANVGGTYVLGATADSGLAVVYEVDAASTSGVCTLSGSTLSFQGVGTCIVNITQPGDGTHARATTQMRIQVGAMSTRVVVTPSSTNIRYAQTQRAQARASFAVGTAVGKVQFRLDGRRLGSPVTVVKGSALSPVLLSATKHPLWPGTHTVTAVFTPSDPLRYTSAESSVKYIVKKLSTKVSVVIGPSLVTATVSPAQAKVTGSVTFTLAGKVIGRVNLRNRVAAVHYVVPASQIDLVSVRYSGNIFMMASTSSRVTSQP